MLIALIGYLLLRVIVSSCRNRYSGGCVVFESLSHSSAALFLVILSVDIYIYMYMYIRWSGHVGRMKGYRSFMGSYK